MQEVLFKNREEAARLLAEKLRHFQGQPAIILAVPRGGVSIGYVLSRELKLPLDIVLAKKIGHPSNEEYAIGAVSMDGVIVDTDVKVSKDYIERETQRLRQSLKDRYRLFRGDKSPVELRNKIVILTDDGIATGHTLLATIQMLRQQNLKQLIVAVPVLPYSTIHKIIPVVDELIYLSAPRYFTGVGAFYDDFKQVSDEEVIQMLEDSESSSS